jgi:CRISPR-associated exonuclease Cas4
MFGFAAFALILLVAGCLMLVRSATLRRQTGLPEGRLVYADTHGQDWRATTKPLYSARYNLTGKPDFVVETPAGLIPVEVKSGQAPRVPYLGHLLQLAAYCLLIEETTGQVPPHGLLNYADALYEVDFTDELRSELLDTMIGLRQARAARNVARSHNQPAKCLACGFRKDCNEALSS